MAPWVSREIKKERPTGAKANITREDDNNDREVFCPYRATNWWWAVSPGFRFALPWAGGLLPLQGVSLVPRILNIMNDR